MPKKKAPEEGAKKVINPNVMGLRPEVLEQPITETLEINYMPYAMSVIVSRAGSYTHLDMYKRQMIHSTMPLDQSLGFLATMLTEAAATRPWAMPESRPPMAMGRQAALSLIHI